MVSMQNLRPLDICSGFLDVLQVSQGISSSEITAMSQHTYKTSAKLSVSEAL